MVSSIEKQSRDDYLEQLIDDLERPQTIQDVGTWLVDNQLDPLPPKHIEVLKSWLETHNDLTIKQNRRGNPYSDIRNVFIYITRLHRDTGMSVSEACERVVERLNLDRDPENLRRAYDRARTPETRLLNDTVKAVGAFNKSGTKGSDMQKAVREFKTRKSTQKPPKNL